MNTKLKSFLWLIFSLAIPLTVGYLGSLLTMPSINTWYATLAKPSINPPNWLFAPVWNTLFILMGIALFLIIREKQGSSVKTKYLKQAYLSFCFQLFLIIYLVYFILFVLYYNSIIVIIKYLIFIYLIFYINY